MNIKSFQYFSFHSYPYSRYVYAIPIIYVKEIIIIHRKHLTQFPNTKNLSFTNFENKIIPIFQLKQFKNKKKMNALKSEKVFKNYLNIHIQKKIKIAILNYKNKIFGIVIYPYLQIIHIEKVLKLEKKLIKNLKNIPISYIGQDKNENKFLILNLKIFWMLQKTIKKL